LKILLTADYHIKLSQKNIPEQWARDRYHLLFEQIYKIPVDIHVIAGDLFDRLPALKELEIYFDFIAGITTPTFIFDGNHCATKKGCTFLGALSKASKNINPHVQIVVDVQEELWGTILPYNKLKEKGLIEKLNKSKPLFTHVRGEIPPHVKPEIDLDRLKDFPLVFAGDLHSHSNTQRNIVYPGSPLTTSFHRSLVETGYIIIDSETLAWDWQAFEIPQLIRKTVTNEEEMVPTDYHHTVYELEGTVKDLSKVKNSDLLDKKIVKTESTATLALSQEMSIEEELSTYLTNIMGLDSSTVSDIIGEFHDCI